MKLSNIITDARCVIILTSGDTFGATGLHLERLAEQLYLMGGMSREDREEYIYVREWETSDVIFGENDDSEVSSATEFAVDEIERFARFVNELPNFYCFYTTVCVSDIVYLSVHILKGNLNAYKDKDKVCDNKNNSYPYFDE